MILQTTPSDEAPSDAAGGDARRVLAQHLAGLGRLAEIGHTIVQALMSRLQSLPDPTGLFRVYDRACWALRLIIALQLKLTRDEKALGAAAGRPETKSPKRDRSERLEREDGDRLDSDGFGRILKRPVEEVVAIICRALGATPELRRLVEAAWAGEALPEDDDELTAEPPSRAPWPRSRPARPKGSPAARHVGRAGPS